MEVVADLHRSIRERFKDVPLEERISDCFDSLQVELIGEVATDGFAWGESSVLS